MADTSSSAVAILALGSANRSPKVVSRPASSPRRSRKPGGKTCVWKSTIMSGRRYANRAATFAPQILSISAGGMKSQWTLR